ncbi:efflux transporter outer membrane subunit [Candidatus Nitronereus thalassa]|uniref:Efflux transporter outer membrane subunit n=1 Tax=Candidatus Nitronereus thalassa TaxID=3020898 RepID=A0ABU3K9W4_9BACT|nr:efflux transporter outer membrane subunit [Candidatus Nitronereus thalassa]MDT7043162.1 efflux transporter outer membrane subunit [Candidatus Nitronereus thalassa]
MRHFLLIIAPLCFLTGCALGPDYERPDIEKPTRFQGQIDGGTEDISLANMEWWDLFHDPQLQSLIRSALVENKDLRLAASRVREARSQYRVTQADQFPQIDGKTSFQRNQTSGAVARQFGIGAGAPSNREGPTTSQWKATLDLSFEIDLWGKIRRATEAAQAELLGKEWAQRTVTLTLVSEIAQAYFDLQELDRELHIAQLTLKTREESLDIIRLRKLMGQSTALDIRRAEQEVARAQALIPDLEQQIGQKEHQLSILIGQNPQTIVRGASLSDQTLPPEVPAGLPSSLLERRPDILEAEQQLVAANAKIGVAKAAFFPQISLTGNFGAQSLEFSDLFIGSSRIWSLGPAITLPIFNAGRNRANLEVSKAQQEQALITYEQTIQQAFREVEDALLLHQKTREIREVEERLLAVSREARQLAQLEYLNGKATYLDVLVAQRELFNAEIAFAQTQRDQLIAVVQVYKAIGGGWSQEPPPHNVAMQDSIQ